MCVEHISFALNTTLERESPLDSISSNLLFLHVRKLRQRTALEIEVTCPYSWPAAFYLDI